jgi:hypothetical protein
MNKRDKVLYKQTSPPFQRIPEGGTSSLPDHIIIEPTECRASFYLVSTATPVSITAGPVESPLIAA